MWIMQNGFLQKWIDLYYLEVKQLLHLEMVKSHWERIEEQIDLLNL